MNGYMYLIIIKTKNMNFNFFKLPSIDNLKYTKDIKFFFFFVQEMEVFRFQKDSLYKNSINYSNLKKKNLNIFILSRRIG